MYAMIPPPRTEKPKKPEGDFARPRTPIAALVLAIVASTLALAAGMILLLAYVLPENLAENRMALEILRNPNIPDDVRSVLRMTMGRMRALPLFLFASTVLGIVAGIMTLGQRRRWAGALLILAALAPAAMFTALAWVHPQGFHESSPVYVAAVIVGLPCLLFMIGGLIALAARHHPVHIPEPEEEEPLVNHEGPPPLPGKDEPDIVEAELAPRRPRGVAIAVSLVALLYVGGFLAITLGLADRLLLGDTTVQRQQPLAIGDPGGLFNPPVPQPPEENPGPGKLPELNPERLRKRLEEISQWAHVDYVQKVIYVRTLPSATDAQLMQLKGMPNVQSLVIQSEQIKGDGLQVLSSLPDLHTLVLSASSIENDAIRHVKDAPALRTLRLENARFSDAGLAHLSGLDQLTFLTVRGSSVTNAGMRFLKGLHALELLGLADTRVGDDGLSHVRQLTKLTTLNIESTDVTDAGLEYLANLTNLRDLDIFRVRGIKGPGLRHLQNLRQVVLLNLGGTGVTNEGLAGIEKLTHLEYLTLPAQIDDAGLVHLANLKNLTSLNVPSNVKGPGLRHLKNLQNLSFRSSQITDDGLAGLKDCIALRSLILPDQIGDRGLAHLEGLKNLEHLSLYGARLTEIGIGHLERLPRLSILTIFGTTEKRLPRLAGLRSVTRLSISGISDPSLAFLKGLPRVTSLTLTGNIGDASVAELIELDSLEGLSIQSEKLTADALAHLQRMASLKFIQLIGTQVTNQAVAQLRRARPELTVHMVPR